MSMMMLARLWTHLRGKRYGEFMWCASGARFYPLDARADEVFIEDIARGLATECRYAGQIAIETEHTFYSVAEHSVLVSGACTTLAELRGWSPAEVLAVSLEGLLHDGAEAYIGDVIRPFKYHRTMRFFRRVEDHVQRKIDLAFELKPTKRSRELVYEIDNRITVDEVQQLIAKPNMSLVRRKFGKSLEIEVRGWSPAEAERQFLTRYFELIGLDNGTNTCAWS